MTVRRPRDGKGNFLPSPDSDARDAEAFRMRTREATLNEIALALGYVDASHVQKALKRHLARIVTPTADEYRKVMDDQLSSMHREVLRVLEATHYKVNNGVVVYHRPVDCGCVGDLAESCPHYKPLVDDAPVLAAVDRLVKIQESRRKLYGLDAPVKHEVEVSTVTVTVKGADDV